MTFEETKARKLHRKPVLRVFNAIGMVAWVDEYGEAAQRLRLIHPLSWVWLVVMASYGIVAQGIPETVKDLRYCLKHETVLI